MAAFALVDVAVPTSSRGVKKETLNHRGLVINPTGEFERNQRRWSPTRYAAKRFGRPVVQADDRVPLGQKSQALTQDGQYQVGRHVRSGFLPKCLRRLVYALVVRLRHDLNGERMTFGAVLVVANGSHVASAGIGLMAKPALLLF